MKWEEDVDKAGAVVEAAAKAAVVVGAGHWPPGRVDIVPAPNADIKNLTQLVNPAIR